MKKLFEMFIREVFIDFVHDLDWPSILESIKALLDLLLK